MVQLFDHERWIRLHKPSEFCFERLIAGLPSSKFVVTILNLA